MNIYQFLEMILRHCDRGCSLFLTSGGKRKYPRMFPNNQYRYPVQFSIEREEFMDKVFTAIKPAKLIQVTKARRRLHTTIMQNISICPESLVALWNSVHQCKSTPMSFVSLMHSVTEVKTPTEGRFDAESLQCTFGESGRCSVI